MRTIVTLIIVVALLNVVGRAGSAYWKYYQFKDTTQETIIFGGVTPTDTLRQQIMEKAGKMEVPINGDELTVTREGQTTRVQAAYVQPIELLPNVVYRQAFTFAVEGVYVGSIKPVR